MPSVEAPTPEAAVVAARERYGNAVRITGVRRIRSGGVLGFFATERFVAEVEDVEPARRGPAPRSESARRIEAALSRDPGPLADTGAFLRATELHRSRPAAARPTTRPAVRTERPTLPTELPDPVSELAGLLGSGDGAPGVDLYSRASVGATRRPAAGTSAFRPAAVRTAAPRAAAGPSTAAPSTAAPSAAAPSAAAPSAARRPARAAVRPPSGPAGPSLFTAALAQVVAGDREVREAVDDAVRSAAAMSAAEALRAVQAVAAATAEATDEELAPPSVLRTPEPSPAAPAMPLAAALAAAMAAPAPAPAAPAPEPVAPVAGAPAAEEPVVEELVAEAPVAEASLPEAPEVPEVAEPADESGPGVDMWADPVPVSRPAAAVVAEPVVEEPVAEEPVVEAPAVEEPVVEAPAVEEHPADEDPEDLDDTEDSLLTELLGPEVDETATDETGHPAAEDPAVEDTAVEDTAAAVTEDEPVTDVLPAVVAEPIEVPAPQPVAAWADADPTGPVTGREEAIAEVLRAALAHDTPDDALTDILRGVLASASTQGGAHRGRPPVPAPSQRVDHEPGWVDAAAESDEWEAGEAVLAPTASDPAPLALDSTAVLPPLSLLPPPTPGAELAVPRLLGRPPVPPARRLPPAPGQAVARVAAPAPGLATVTRLPVDARAARGWTPARVVVPSVREAGAVAPGRGWVDPRMVEAAGTVARLRALGVPEDLLGAGFPAEVATSGTYAALTRALGAALPAAPTAPAGAGEVLLVVGPGVETLAAARSLAAGMRLDGDRLQWATRGDLAALAPGSSRITSVDTAIARKQDAAAAGTPTVVAVDAPMRAGSRTWLEQVMAIFSPVAVWAVVEATRKPEDVGPWLDALPRVDALVVQDSDLTADPAAVLGRTPVPVALLDGVRATAHRWASLLCERLETAEA
ncbi:hypothetical protein ACI79J_11405 [Geodermatophilus sp. SYSU D01062]